MKVLILVLLAMASLSWGQTAQVIALDPADAVKAKQLDDAVTQAIKERDDFKKSIGDKYLYISKSPTDMNSFFPSSQLKPGWNSQEFQYSTDFKYIVPGYPTSSVCTCCATNLPTWIIPSNSIPPSSPNFPYSIPPSSPYRYWN